MGARLSLRYNKNGRVHMKTKITIEFLRRYTNFPSLLDILQNKRITLLDPISWDDKNDSFFIEQYKKRKNLRTVLALCFTGKGETYHHWKVFSSGHSGICIVFNKDKLLHELNNSTDSEGIIAKKVSYKKINDKSNSRITLEELPFIKRLPYKDEKEFRVIYNSINEDLFFKHFHISLESIDKIIVNPWVPEPLFASIKKTIKGITDCQKIKVIRTTLISNEKWKKFGKSIVE